MGNFVSLIGFVNYELFVDSDNFKFELLFCFNIEVCKEELVFSGFWVDQEFSWLKRKSFGCRIIVGGILIVGIVYVVGVMVEFFSIGGLDGFGLWGL